jgi:hypothetical protein
MINITNGINHMTVTAGVFKEIFAPQGWTKVEAEESVVSLPESEDFTTQQVNQEVDEETSENGELEDSDDESDEMDDESNPNEDESEDDLEERPLSELSYEELQKLAKIKGLNTDGMRSKKEIRQALKNM